jgi:hypothetical protein
MTWIYSEFDRSDYRSPARAEDESPDREMKSDRKDRATSMSQQFLICFSNLDTADAMKWNIS